MLYNSQMNYRIGWYGYEEIGEIGFIPVNITPEAYKYLQQVKKDKIAKETTLEKNVENSACTDEHRDV